MTTAEFVAWQANAQLAAALASIALAVFVAAFNPRAINRWARAYHLASWALVALRAFVVNRGVVAGNDAGGFYDWAGVVVWGNVAVASFALLAAAVVAVEGQARRRRGGGPA